MKRKRLRVVSIVVLLGIIAAIPASTQVVSGSGGDDEQSNLPLLVAVNKMELTVEQMQEIHDLLVGLLEEREALETRLDEFEADMIAFNGTAEELDQILEAFRAEMAEQAEAARAKGQSVIDEIKGVLTLKQGEVLAELIPGVLAAGGFGPRVGESAGFGPSALRERVLAELDEQLADHPVLAERLQERLGDRSGALGLQGTQQGAGTLFGRRSGGRMGAAAGQMAQGMGLSQRLGALGGRMTHRGLDWIERLVEVLELKLEAIE